MVWPPSVFSAIPAKCRWVQTAGATAFANDAALPLGRGAPSHMTTLLPPTSPRSELQMLSSPLASLEAFPSSPLLTCSSPSRPLAMVGIVRARMAETLATVAPLAVPAARNFGGLPGAFAALVVAAVLATDVVAVLELAVSAACANTAVYGRALDGVGFAVCACVAVLFERAARAAGALLARAGRLVNRKAAPRETPWQTCSSMRA